MATGIATRWEFSAALLALALAGCTQFPQLDAAQGAGVADAPYPDLLTIDRMPAPLPDAGPSEPTALITLRADGLRGRAPGIGGAGFDPVAGLDARIAALRARAEALRAQ